MMTFGNEGFRTSGDLGLMVTVTTVRPDGCLSGSLHFPRIHSPPLGDQSVSVVQFLGDHDANIHQDADRRQNRLKHSITTFPLQHSSVLVEDADTEVNQRSNGSANQLKHNITTYPP